MPRHIWTHTLNRGTSPNPSLAVTVEGDGENPRVIDVPPLTTDQQIIIAFTIAALKSLMVKADGALTLKTNSTSSPGNTFALDSDSGIAWDNQSNLANPITANVTTMYVTNAHATETRRLEIYALVDSTP